MCIHTNQKGDVARDVDKGTSPVNAIVSVIMLREGWDVQGVTVIVNRCSRGWRLGT